MQTAKSRQQHSEIIVTDMKDLGGKSGMMHGGSVVDRHHDRSGAGN